MPGSMLSWESEDYLVEEYEGLIKARTNTVWESKGPMHFSEVYKVRNNLAVAGNMGGLASLGGHYYPKLRDHA